MLESEIFIYLRLIMLRMVKANGRNIDNRYIPIELVILNVDVRNISRNNILSKFIFFIIYRSTYLFFLTLHLDSKP